MLEFQTIGPRTTEITKIRGTGGGGRFTPILSHRTLKSTAHWDQMQMCLISHSNLCQNSKFGRPDPLYLLCEVRRTKFHN